MSYQIRFSSGLFLLLGIFVFCQERCRNKGLLIDTINGYLYRMIFREVVLMQKNRPIFDNQPLTRPNNFDEYWMNTPLKKNQ